MREIKFRAWNGYSMFVPQLIGGDNNKVYSFTQGDSSLEEFSNITIMQYTGFKDKNGKEIYEGDVVISEGINKHVEWHDFGAWVTRPRTGFYFDDDMLSESIEVIGNIYENKELLK